MDPWTDPFPCPGLHLTETSLRLEQEMRMGGNHRKIGSIGFHYRINHSLYNDATLMSFPTTILEEQIFAIVICFITLSFVVRHVGGTSGRCNYVPGMYPYGS